MKKLKTISLQGKEYAQVKDRILEFRKDTVRGSITTEVEFKDGLVVMKATVITDLADEHSRRATGQAFGKVGGQKEFEKLETIAVGRALAFLGYAADGAVASSEEMEDFQDYVEEKKQNALKEMSTCKTQDELKTVFLSLGTLMADKDIIAKKDEMKLKLVTPITTKLKVSAKSQANENN